jgi:hypothetical protein
MKQRGKKSATAVATQEAVAVVNRPEPPLDLAPEEADVWSEIVDAMPADWFPRETWPLLKQYCRHAIMARRAAQLIDQASARNDLDIAELKELAKMQRDETSALKAMAASMRLSQQASYSARGAGGEKSRRSTVKRPWES